MSWKKTTLYFIFQSLWHSQNWSHFKAIWSHKSNWKNSFKRERNSVADEMPWINFLALNYLKNNIGPQHRVFEFGGGGSTLFFCKNVAQVVTVEDNEEWFQILQKTVSDKQYTNWTGYFSAPEPVSASRSRSPHNPNDFKSSVKGWENMTFERYARTIDNFPDQYFDLILVDGRARPSCIQQSLPRLRHGGLLVIDNTERPHYLVAFKEVLAENFIIEENRFAPVAYSPDFTQTTILRKL